VIGILCGIIMNWFLEFLVLDAIFVGFASWRYATLGSSDITWMIPSLFRASLVSVAAVCVYIYLSPERFAEDGSGRGGGSRGKPVAAHLSPGKSGRAYNHRHEVTN